MVKSMTSMNQLVMASTMLLTNIAILFSYIYLERGVPFMMTLLGIIAWASYLLYAFNHFAKHRVSTKVVIALCVSSIIFCIMTAS